MTQSPVADDATYRIVRFYAPHTRKENETIEEGVTLAEAQEHCADPATKGSDFFDGYQKEP